MRRALLLWAFTACIGLAQSKGESEGLPRLVKLNVAAIDARGEPVTDLRATEVSLREDGRPRHIAFFRFAGSKRPALATGPGEFAPPSTPPITVILLDRWNERMMTTASAWGELSRQLRNLESTDRVYLYMLTNHGDLYPIRAIPGTQADARAAGQVSAQQLATMLDDAVKKLQGFRDIDEKDPIIRFNVTAQALTALGTQMAAVAGRKSLIWVTHGVPLAATLVPSTDWADFTPQVKTLGAAAAQAGIAIFTVQQSSEGAGATPDLFRTALQMVSNLTGGRWFPSDDIDRAAAAARADARGNYTLVYFAPMVEKDKKYHKIRLNSTRKDVHFQTIEGYDGDTPVPDPDAMEEAIVSAARRSPFDASEIGVRVAVSQDPRTKVGLFRIRVDLADLLLVPRNDHYQGRLGVTLAASFESFVTGAMARFGVDMDFTEDQYRQAAKDGLVVSKSVPIPDKAQTVRVIVYDRELHAVGSATLPVISP